MHIAISYPFEAQAEVELLNGRASSFEQANKQNPIESSLQLASCARYLTSSICFCLPHRMEILGLPLIVETRESGQIKQGSRLMNGANVSSLLFPFFAFVRTSASALAPSFKLAEELQSNLITF